MKTPPTRKNRFSAPLRPDISREVKDSSAKQKRTFLKGSFVTSVSQMMLSPELLALVATYIDGNISTNVYLTHLAGEFSIREFRTGNSYVNGLLHSFNDQPARIDSIGTKEWFRRGKLHRYGDEPAIVNDNDKWYDDSKITEHVPAMKLEKAWYKDGKAIMGPNETMAIWVFMYANKPRLIYNEGLGFPVIGDI